MALVINVKNENLLVEMGKLIQEKTAKTVQKMFDLVPLSVVTEKLKLLKIVKIVQKTFQFVRLPVEMKQSIQERIVIMGKKMEKTENVQSLALLLIQKNQTVEMEKLIHEKTVLTVLKT